MLSRFDIYAAAVKTTFSFCHPAVPTTLLNPSSPPFPPAQESAFGILVVTSRQFAKISATGSPPPPPGGPGLVHGNLLKKVDLRVREVHLTVSHFNGEF